MNLNTDQSFKYSGQVCIKAISNNICYKTINVKNSGTNYLFKIFRDALTGSQKNTDRVSTLRLYSGSNNQALTEVTFENFTLSDSDADNSVTFKFYVPFYKLSAGTEIGKLGLFSEGTAQSRQALAFITLENAEDKIIADGSTDFIIYWKLSVSN